MLASFQPGIVLSSEEPTARETAEAIAGRLSVQTEIVKGLHEHQRQDIPFMTRPEFEAAIASLFDRPMELVLGEETARQAQRRFTRAIERIIGDQGEGDIVVVTHGTIIALFVSGVAGVEPFALWKQLGLPSFVVLSLPGLRLLESVKNVV
jgi:broad specificity phosphatase PhoE